MIVTTKKSVSALPKAEDGKPVWGYEPFRKFAQWIRSGLPALYADPNFDEADMWNIYYASVTKGFLEGLIPTEYAFSYIEKNRKRMLSTPSVITAESTSSALEEVAMYAVIYEASYDVYRRLKTVEKLTKYYNKYKERTDAGEVFTKEAEYITLYTDLFGDDEKKTDLGDISNPNAAVPPVTGESDSDADDESDTETGNPSTEE